MSAEWLSAGAVRRGSAAGDGDELHVWHAVLGSGGAGDAALLSADERERAEAFAWPELRRRWVWARATLRRVLAAYAELDPAALVFAYGEHGRPSLAGRSDLSFSLSHSDVRLVVVVARGRGRAVGVDVERVSRCAAPLAVAERFFAASEAARLAALPAAGRAAAFAALWTAKEAYAKALGRGIGLPLSDCALIGELTAPALTRTAAVDPRGPDEWVLAQTAPAPDYVCTAAVAGRRLVIVERELTLH
ncbi:MAG: 4'-phosphopantetheinyl transferase family protein [Solirubrobacteraceae bacterium]